MLLWIVPMANQEFRQLVFGRDGATVWKGINELTLGELSQQIDSDRRSGLWVGHLLVSYHMRWALSCATLVLALFALSVTRHLVARWTVALAAFGICLGYYALLWAGRGAAVQDALPAFAGAWLPNVVLAIVSVTLLKLTPPSAQRALQ
jgi:lipopolysaccharide export LptBFGC system permease protein LptF